MQGQALPHRVAQLPQLGGGGELGDLAAHQLVQLVGGEGGDDQALLVGERGEELLEEHERWPQAVLGADEGRKELVQLLYQPFLLQKLSSHTDGSWQAVHVVGDVVGVFHRRNSLHVTGRHQTSY